MCGWQVKLCDTLVTHGPYLSALMWCIRIKRCINSRYFTYFIYGEECYAMPEKSSVLHIVTSESSTEACMTFECVYVACIGLGCTKFVSFEDRHWHSDCFVCSQCSVSLVGQGFLLEDNAVLCPDCGQA